MSTEVLPDTTFFGVPLAQTWEDLQLYERILNAHPDLRCIVELGTYYGGLSWYLHGQAQHRRMSFFTYDLTYPEFDVPGFRQLDVLINAGLVMRPIVESDLRPFLVICDNGNKIQEMATYAPLMQPGDLLAVHDWGTEVNEEDVPEVLQPIHTEWCTSMTRVFSL